MLHAAPHAPALQAATVFGIEGLEQTLPHALQLLASVCRLTQVVGLAVGQGFVADAVRAAQVPLAAPVAAFEQPWQERLHALPQHMPSTQKPLVHSPTRLQATPVPFLGEHEPALQKLPAAHSLSLVQVVTHALADAQAVPPGQARAELGVQVPLPSQLPAGVSVLTEQLAVPHDLVSGCTRQAPLPLQVPSLPHAFC